MTQHSSISAQLPFDQNLWSLYQRSGSKNWYMRFSIRGHGQQRRALNTPDHNEAMRLAPRIYYETLAKAESGLSPKHHTVEQAVELFMESMRTHQARHRLTDIHLRQMEITTGRYIAGFWGNKPTSAITEKSIDEFINWRHSYWTTGPGAEETHTTYMRNGRRVQTPIPSRWRVVPKPSTVNSELVTLRAFLNFCRRESMIPDVPVVKNVRNPPNARPSFTDSEMVKFQNHLLTRIQQSKPDSKNLFDRVLFYGFCVVMIESGIRTAEALKLNWGDVLGYEPNAMPFSQRITLQITGKFNQVSSKDRVCLTNPAISNGLDVLWQVYSDVWGRSPMPSDPLFAHQNGERIKSFSAQMNNILAELDMKTDYRGQPRCAYSFRHYFITQQLNDGVPIHFVAKNAGTSSDMIEKHYSHVSLAAHYDTIIPERHRS